VIGALADTGFLVALFSRRDRLRRAAREHLEAHTYPLATVAPVIVETSFFLGSEGKADLLDAILRGAIAVSELPPEAYREIKTLVLKYADRDVDFADVALIWFAGVSGCRSILTVDERDFGVYRIKGNKRFEVIPWQ
jgi:predicted nucleic acid-binding protein